MATLDLPTKEDLLRVEAKLDRLLKIMDCQRTITVAEISKRTGLSECCLRYSSPWLLPDFGVSQYPGKKRWDLDKYESWVAIPEKDRKKNFLDSKRTETRRAYRRVSPPAHTV